MPKTANRVIKNTGYLYAKMGIQVFLSLYTTRLILDALGATDFGIYGIVGSAIGLLSFLQNVMSVSTQRFISYAEGENNETNKLKVFANSLLLHLIIAFTVVAILEFSSYFFFNGVFQIPDNRVFAAKVIYQCAVLTVFLTILRSPLDGLINAHENMLFFSVLEVVDSVLKLLAAIIVSISLIDHLCLYGLMMAAITILTTIAFYEYCKHKYPESRNISKKNIDVRLIKKMGCFAGWDGLGSITWIFFHQGNAILLNHFFGTVYNAAHSLAYQLNGQVGALGTTALRALNPVITKEAGAKDIGRMYCATRMGNNVSFFLISLCNLPILVHLHSLLNWWLKEIPICSETFITLYFAAILVESLSMCLIVAIRGVGDVKGFQLACSICNIVAPVAIIILFSAHYPAFVIYVLMIITSALKLGIRIYYAFKVCGFPLWEMINDSIRSSVVFFLGLLAAIGLKHLMGEADPLMVVVQIVVNVVIYGIIYYYVGFNKSDKLYIRSVLVTGLKRYL